MCNLFPGVNEMHPVLVRPPVHMAGDDTGLEESVYFLTKAFCFCYTLDSHLESTTGKSKPQRKSKLQAAHLNCLFAFCFALFCF